MTKLAQIDELKDADHGDQFLKFMENEGQYDKSELGIWMDSNLATRRERLLASFVLVASGCWKRDATNAHVAEPVVKELDTIHRINSRDIREKIMSGLAARLTKIDEEEGNRREWLHNHRYQYLNPKGTPEKMAEDVVMTVEGLSCAIGDYETLEAYVDSKLENEPDPFWTIFLELAKGHDIHGLSRLSTFDFLELANRGGGINDLYPREPHFEYVSSNKPKRGLRLVYCYKARDSEKQVMDMNKKEMMRYLGVKDKSELDELVKILCNAARSQLSWNEKTVLFDVESCLCNFAKSESKNFR